MAGTEYHEPPESLSPQCREIHRAIASLIEELEAVDWYNQRADVTGDEDIRAIMAHNRDEEIEHACMALEYLRRNMDKWDEELTTYLFTSGPITELEEEATSEEVSATEATPETSPQGDLGIGSLKEGEK